MRKITKQTIKIRNDSGFSITETIIAIALFGSLMIVALGMFIWVSRIYYKSLYNTRLQAVATNVHDAVTESIQATGTNIVAFCYDIDGRVHGYSNRLKVADLEVPSNISSASSLLSDVENCKKTIEDPNVGARGVYWTGYCTGNILYAYKPFHQLVSAKTLNNASSSTRLSDSVFQAINIGNCTEEQIEDALPTKSYCIDNPADVDNPVTHSAANIVNLTTEIDCEADNPGPGSNSTDGNPSGIWKANSFSGYCARVSSSEPQDVITRTDKASCEKDININGKPDGKWIIGSRELLREHMRVLQFKITKKSNAGLYQISIRLAYGGQAEDCQVDDEVFYTIQDSNGDGEDNEANQDDNDANRTNTLDLNERFRFVNSSECGGPASNLGGAKHYANIDILRCEGAEVYCSVITIKDNVLRRIR